MKSLNMKKSLLCILALTGVFAASLRAGTETYKQVAPPPPPPLYGIGFYGAIDAGANVFQNLPGSRTFTENDPDSPFFGESLEVSPQHNVGVFAGLKLGYVFLKGVIRPTIELDSFYNGFDTDTNFTLREPDGDVIRSGSSSNRINSGVWLGNFILRFAPGNQKFQPYFGAGVGVYYAESAGTEIVDPITGAVPVSTGGGRNHADLAFDVVAGSDYFFTPNFSAFIEYKFLDYTSTQIDTRQDRDLKQQLLGAGVRFFFH